MRAIKEARKYIERHAESDHAQTLSRLVLALESEADFPIANLYTLDLPRFKLALEILDEWRLDRHYASKSKLFDVSMQMTVLSQAKPQSPGSTKDRESDRGETRP